MYTQRSGRIMWKAPMERYLHLKPNRNRRNALNRRNYRIVIPFPHRFLISIPYPSKLHLVKFRFRLHRASRATGAIPRNSNTQLVRLISFQVHVTSVRPECTQKGFTSDFKRATCLFTLNFENESTVDPNTYNEDLISNKSRHL